ncbi:MAG: HlyD family efflux transporter periplasmic adaptor subunit [Desulfococcaceae bacterium]|jgi:HlyD family secretion protein|nr:HlyD family efflux transporter periplasmic adaptor subunit [Desulfococcaceae bacterium]
MKTEKNSHDMLENHEPDGIDILLGRTSAAAGAVIYIFLALLLSVSVWAFIGRADLIISAEGQVEPRLDMQNVYASVGGELMDIYVMEGSILAKGDLIARIHSKDAVKAAGDAEKARINLEKAEADKKMFPQKKILYEIELKNMEKKIQKTEKDYLLFEKDHARNLPAIQQHRLGKARLKKERTEKERYLAKEIYEKYKRLSDLENGGVSQKEVQEKEELYLKAENTYRETCIDLDNLEYEFSQEENQYSKRVRDSRMELAQLHFQYDNRKIQFANEEKQVEIQYKAALAAWESASVITFDDLDEDNFLKVRAPVAGEVTALSAKQRGEKIKADAPLLAIAPLEAEKILKIRIPDQDRGLLRTGQPVKLRFSAFPYQRYGFITGILEYISPDALADNEGKQFYEGRIGLDREYAKGDGKQLAIRYGMTAVAEISVQKRRIIDWVTDPFRKLSNRYL